MKSSNLIFSFLIAVFFSLAAMLFDSLSWLGRFRGGVESVFRPEARILSLASVEVGRWADRTKYFSSGPARIADLERRLAGAEREAIFSVRRQEKAEAPPILDWAGERGFGLTGAQVLSFGPQLVIEIPPDNKVSGDQVVLSPEGALVGSIAGVGRWSAKVKLLSDSNSQIAAAVLAPDRQKLAAGVVTGSFGTAVSLEKVLTEVNLEPDLAVVTSGEDDLFPPDLLIGWIGKNAAKEVSSVYQKAEVVPAAKIKELKTVFIIESLKR